MLLFGYGMNAFLTLFLGGTCCFSTSSSHGNGSSGEKPKGKSSEEDEGMSLIYFFVMLPARNTKDFFSFLLKETLCSLFMTSLDILLSVAGGGVSMTFNVLSIHTCIPVPLCVQTSSSKKKS